MQTIQKKVEFLSRRDSYAERPRQIEVVETHFAWVFLTPRYVYKMKKPLRHDTMDYRTLAARGRGCRDELQLNRRLARRIYLAVVPLSVDAAGRLRLGRGVRIVD